MSAYAIQIERCPMRDSMLEDPRYRGLVILRETESVVEETGDYFTADAAKAAAQIIVRRLEARSHDR